MRESEKEARWDGDPRAESVLSDEMPLEAACLRGLMLAPTRPSNSMVVWRMFRPAVTKALESHEQYASRQSFRLSETSYWHTSCQRSRPR